MLTYIGFGVILPDAPSGWDDWTPQAELKRRAADEAWLATQGVLVKGGREAAYPWGTIGSYYDAKNGTWSTSLRYRSETK